MYRFIFKHIVSLEETLPCTLPADLQILPYTIVYYATYKKASYQSPYYTTMDEMLTAFDELVILTHQGRQLYGVRTRTIGYNAMLHSDSRYSTTNMPNCKECSGYKSPFTRDSAQVNGLIQCIDCKNFLRDNYYNTMKHIQRCGKRSTTKTCYCMPEQR